MTVDARRDNAVFSRDLTWDQALFFFSFFASLLLWLKREKNSPLPVRDIKDNRERAWSQATRDPKFVTWSVHDTEMVNKTQVRNIPFSNRVFLAHMCPIYRKTAAGPAMLTKGGLKSWTTYVFLSEHPHQENRFAFRRSVAPEIFTLKKRQVFYFLSNFMLSLL